MQLSVRLLDREPRLAPDDEAEGERLRDLLQEALERGPAAPVAVVVRAGRTELVHLGHLRGTHTPVFTFLAGLTRSIAEDAGSAEAVGLVGTLQLRNQRDKNAVPIPVAVAFLEWEDGRWWEWRALLDADGTTLREDTSTVRSARQGDPLPDGIGRWWSAGRRRGGTMKLSRATPKMPAETSPIVH